MNNPEVQERAQSEINNLDLFNSKCLDVLHRAQMISDSAYQSQHTSLSPSRASTLGDAASSAASTAVTDIDSKMTVTLGIQVSAGGTNFSQDQRQVIAMTTVLIMTVSLCLIKERLLNSTRR
ncbi:hypothetical protein AZE42_11751 [Rhizopogon vesiculosus]|uniref:Uncharacterized protein n=2 Tax=Rhizopogon vesiculosus TaxID=180088 RepID=A0A1J8PQE5_9AGAM|nr:hypothetical protein AZE42_11751 [Rhizopogon vesiculosus]